MFSCALFYCFSDYQDGVGEGGPYEGNDICVYHVETDFLLGDDVEIDGRNQTSQPWIWPVCHPKNDDDHEFESDRGMIAGWLDAPPIDQIFSKLLGSGVSEAEVYRSVGMTKIYFTLFITLSDLTIIQECRAPSKV